VLKFARIARLRKLIGIRDRSVYFLNVSLLKVNLIEQFFHFEAQNSRNKIM